MVPHLFAAILRIVTKQQCPFHVFIMIYSHVPHLFAARTLLFGDNSQNVRGFFESKAGWKGHCCLVTILRMAAKRCGTILRIVTKQQCPFHVFIMIYSHVPHLFAAILRIVTKQQCPFQRAFDSKKPKNSRKSACYSYALHKQI